MGVSYAARALIGCRFFGKEIFTKKRVKAFEHPYNPTDDVNFDPKTGRPLWMEINVCLLGDLEDVSSVEARTSLQGLYCFDNAAERNEDREVLVGLFGVEQDAEQRGWRNKPFVPLSGPDVDRAQELCQKVLEPLGLWKPARFGIHVMQYVSC